MTNEQVALQEAVKYVTTYYSTKFAIDRDKETETILEIADTFNKQLYNMRAEYEAAVSSKTKTTRLPGIDPNQVIPSDPQMVSPNLIREHKGLDRIPELSDGVTRLEVIDKQGRVYSQWNCSIELSYQDDGKTLKVFVKN